MSGTSADPYSHAPRITPSPSTKKALRRETPFIPRYSCAMPNPSVASPFQSDKSGNSKSSAWAHAMCVYGESREMANGWTPASSNARLLSRRSFSSSVQVALQSNR